MSTAKYSKVERKIWRDDKLREFPRIEPCPGALWHYLLFNEAQTAFPGLYVLRLVVAADDLRWTVDEVRTQLAAIVAKGMVVFDERTSVVWLPNALRKHSDGLSENNTKGWRNAWNEMPDSPVTREAFFAAVETIRETLTEEGRDPAKALAPFSIKVPQWAREADCKPVDAPSTRPSLTLQTKEQEKDQDHEREQEWDPLRGPPAASSSSTEADIAHARRLVAEARRAPSLASVADQDMLAWAKGVLDTRASDYGIAPHVDLSVYVRSAVGRLRDIVAATPTKPIADQLSYLRRGALGKARDDKANGYAMAKAGTAAPPPSRGEGSGLDEDHEREERQRLVAQHEQRFGAGGGR